MACNVEVWRGLTNLLLQRVWKDFNQLLQVRLWDPDEEPRTKKLDGTPETNPVA